MHLGAGRDLALELLHEAERAGRGGEESPLHLLGGVELEQLLLELLREAAASEVPPVELLQEPGGAALAERSRTVSRTKRTSSAATSSRDGWDVVAVDDLPERPRIALRAAPDHHGGGSGRGEHRLRPRARRHVSRRDVARAGAGGARHDRSRRRDGRARRAGQSVGAPEIVDGDDVQPSREEVAAELVLFVRETVRELGERRASGFLKKFYGWYLGRGRFPKEFKQELLQLHSTEEVERRLLAAAPGAFDLVEQLESEIPSGSEVTLELPVSIYGGG